MAEQWNCRWHAVDIPLQFLEWGWWYWAHAWSSFLVGSGPLIMFSILAFSSALLSFLLCDHFAAKEDPKYAGANCKSDYKLFEDNTSSIIGCYQVRSWLALSPWLSLLLQWGPVPETREVRIIWNRPLSEPLSGISSDSYSFCDNPPLPDIIVSEYHTYFWSAPSRCLPRKWIGQMHLNTARIKMAH